VTTITSRGSSRRWSWSRRPSPPADEREEERDADGLVVVAPDDFLERVGDFGERLDAVREPPEDEVERRVLLWDFLRGCGICGLLLG
jgi:hypothetical protein